MIFGPLVSAKKSQIYYHEFKYRLIRLPSLNFAIADFSLSNSRYYVAKFFIIFIFYDGFGVIHAFRLFLPSKFLIIETFAFIYYFKSIYFGLDRDSINYFTLFILTAKDLILFQFKKDLSSVFLFWMMFTGNLQIPWSFVVSCRLILHGISLIIFFFSRIPLVKMNIQSTAWKCLVDDPSIYRRCEFNFERRWTYGISLHQILLYNCR